MNADAPIRRSRGRPKVAGLADQRRTQIIEAAFRVLTERGYEGTSIAEIAQEAGIGQGTVYRYVSSKRDLLDQVFDWVDSIVLQSLTHAIEHGWLVLSTAQKPVVARMLMMMSLPGVVMSLRPGIDVAKRARYVDGAAEIALHGILKR